MNGLLPKKGPMRHLPGGLMARLAQGIPWGLKLAMTLTLTLSLTVRSEIP